MSTIPNQCVDAGVALLNSPAPPAGVPVATRCFMHAIDPASLPSISGYLEEIDVSKPDQASRAVTEDDVLIKFECRVKGTSSVAPDVAADPLIAHVVGRLAGHENGVTLGRLYRVLLFAGVKYEYVQQDHAYCMATVRFIARSQHQTGDLETWA